MDKSIVVVEESHPRSDHLASSSKSSVSLIQIDSIAIDISCEMGELDIPQHEHFSIRGFVAGMRKKNFKICSPFDSEGENGFVDSLPLLSVPKFRWWQCSECVPEIVSARNAPEMLLTDRRDIVATTSYGTLGGEKGFLALPNIENTGSDEQGVIRINEDGNPSGYVAEANPIQIWDRRDNGADDSDMVHDVENPSIRADSPENGSSGSDGVFAALPHRRKQKLRSLADIMDTEKTSASGHLRTGSASSNGTHSTSTAIEADTQLRVLSEGGKGTRSPRRKRKIALNESRAPESRAPPETSYPTGAAKKLKGHVREAEITPRRVEISDSEAETVASTRSEFHVSSSMPRVKPKQIKVMHSTKSRQAHVENRRIIMRDGSKLNAAGSENVRKPISASVTSLGWTAPVAFPLGRVTVPFPNGLPSGQPMHRISEASNSKRPEDEVDNSSVVAPGASILRHSNINGKVALDLSLSPSNAAERSSKIEKYFMEHRGIPDLNESITEKTYIMEETELPTISQKKTLNLDKTSEMSVYASKANASVDKRPLDISEVRTIRRTDENVEIGGASDDIPMEIVELLAKNQQERALENSRNYFPPRDINNSGGGSRAVNLDGCSGTINFPFANTASLKSQNIAARQGILSSPQEKDCQLNAFNPGASQFRLFSPMTQNQQSNPAYLTSSSITSRSGESERADLLWPPRRKNLPFNLTVGPKSPTQTNGFSLPLFTDQCYKGKAIYGTNVLEKNVIHDASAVEEVRVPSGLKSVGSLDAYSNLDIPAMQLLSLTNQGIASSLPFQVSRYSFLDTSFSPCNHHPRLSRNENKDEPIFSSSFFSQSNHVKNNGANVSGENFNKSYLQAQLPPQQGSSKAAQSTGRSNLEPSSSSNNPPLEVCTLNRNPADFSFPDANNEFMIGAKDLKFKKRLSSKKRLPPVTEEVQKRKWVRKNSLGKQGVLPDMQRCYNNQDQHHKIKKVRKLLPQKNAQTNTYR